MVYQIKDFSDWKAEDAQLAGANEKLWLSHGSEAGIFKFAKVNNGIACGEFWSEKMAEDIFTLLGIPCMKVDIGSYKGRLGSMCYDITQEYGTFTEAVDLLHKVTYRAGRFKLEDLRERVKDETFSDIVVMLVVDYLIGNNDRHTGNFAVLHSTGELAPMYDNGSSLACRLDPNSIKSYYKDKMKYESYVFNKPRSACINEEGKEYKHIELMRKLINEYPSLVLRSLGVMEILTKDSLLPLMTRFMEVTPDAILTFNVKVILDRLKKLKELVYGE